MANVIFQVDDQPPFALAINPIVAGSQNNVCAFLKWCLMVIRNKDGANKNPKMVD